MSGPDVAAWQGQATARGFAVTVDGVYGSASKQACMALQRALGLSVDGIVGPKTWTATFA
jgi:peptidoglycan hydrolase-like protein with peptidoglycan-binding domain